MRAADSRIFWMAGSSRVICVSGGSWEMLSVGRAKAGDGRDSATSRTPTAETIAGLCEGGWVDMTRTYHRKSDMATKNRIFIGAAKRGLGRRG